MAKNKEASTTEKIGNKFSTFVVSNKNIIIIVAAAIVVALIALGIGLKVSDNRANARQVAIDQLQEQYNEWITEDGADASDLKGELAALAKRGGKNYPAVKAIYLQGLIAYQEGAYAEATTYFLSVVERNRDGYLAPLALFNAGVSSEQLGDSLKAIEYYQRVYDNYGNDAVESPRALFSLARLYEAEGEKELARAMFQQLSDEFPASEFARLAKNRLVTLQ